MRVRSRRLSAPATPLLFLAVTLVGIVAADLDPARLSADVFDRFARNLFLVLALVIPIVAGMGLNFAIVLGAMAGQTGLILVQNGGVGGIPGLVAAIVLSIPLATLLGYLTGLLFNRAKGREMITGLILGLFAGGVYQLVYLILAGPVLPIRAPDVLLPQGMGVRVTVNLTTVERALEDLVTIPLRFGGEYWGEIPVVTWLLSALLCAGMVLFFRTKVGQDLRAVGQDQHVAQVAGIRVLRCRILAVVLSMVLAGIGQILWLENMTVMNTYTAHEQVGFYAIAALLVGGASVARASIWNAVVGAFLFHPFLVVVSVGGQKLMHSAQVGEYLREFVGFAIIGTAIALHAWRGRHRAR